MTHQVPWLRSGVGETPADGGCIMQVIDWVHSGGWTDSPECVSPPLRALAIRANDTLDDDGRQRLLDLAPRLIGTAGDDRVDRMLACWCVEQVLPIYEKAYPRDDRPRLAIQAARDYANGVIDAAEVRRAAADAYDAYDADAANYANYAALAVAYTANASAYTTNASAYANYAADAAACVADVMELLTGCLDEYDRLTGRTTTADVDWTPVCEVMQA